MQIISALVLTFLIASLFLNAFLIYAFLIRKRPKTLAQDAQALLHDLTEGSTILKIDVLDKGALFLRSPRDMR